MKHLLNWDNVAPDTWGFLVEEALRHGNDRTYKADVLSRKRAGFVFFNDSLRTRVSMELAAAHLGMTPVVVTPGNGTWGFAWDKNIPMTGLEAEHIQEAVGVLSRYVDVLGVRLFASGTDLEADVTDSLLNQFAAASAVPVVHLESAARYPCQALADAAVLSRQFSGDTKGKRFVLSWAPHPKPLPMAVPNSTLLMAARMGMDVTLACPAGFELDESVMQTAEGICSGNGGSVRIVNDQHEACSGADVIYAKSWGAALRYEDSSREATIRTERSDWTITDEKLDSSRFMHCLPVRRGVVVENSVLDGNQSLHLDQAEYRLHAQKAILHQLLDQ